MAGVEYRKDWDVLASYFAFKELATAPATPESNVLRLYVKDSAGVSTLCYKNDAGTEICLPTSGSFVTGTGVANRLAYWTGASTIDDVPRTFTAGSILFAGVDFLPQEDNSNLFYNDTTNRVGIGTPTPATTLQVSSLPGYTDGDNKPQVEVTDTTAFAAGVGGGIAFSGKYNSAGDVAGWAGIRSLKENATDGNFAATLDLITRPAGGANTVRFRVGSAGQWGIGGATYGTTGLPFVSGGALAAPSWTTLDHGAALTGLADDDHTQYSLFSFKTIAVSGQSDVVADARDDTLTLAAGSGITITTNAGTDTITITGSGSTNALLDGSNHTDTVAQTVSRGSLVYGNTTPKWDELTVSGSAGTFLRNDATDVMWSTLILPNGATANRVVYATAANTYGEDPDLTFDGTDLALGSGSKFKMQGQNRIRYHNAICIAARTTAQSITTATTTLISFNGTDIVDTDAMHDPGGANPSRVSANLTGKYFAFLFGLFDVSAGPPNGERGFFLEKNSAGSHSAAALQVGSVSVEGTVLLPEVSIACIVDMTAGDYIEGFCYQNSGGNLDLAGDVVTCKMGLAYIGE